jgi:hypothetical protein
MRAAFTQQIIELLATDNARPPAIRALSLPVRALVIDDSGGRTDLVRVSGRDLADFVKSHGHHWALHLVD